MNFDAPLWWEDGALCLIDQTVLPHEVRIVRCTSWEEVAEAIRTLRVRGAPAIGLAAAYGIALAAGAVTGATWGERLLALRGAAADLAATRPTAVSLTWSLRRMLDVAEGVSDPSALPSRLLEAAH